MIENWFGDVKGVDTIDIHGGGQDLIFPHHENELAQSRCVHGRAPLARYWVHNGFVDMGAEKMSKSLGNVVTVEDLLAQGHRGEVLRLTLLQTHYSSPLPWTDSAISQSKATWEKWNSQFNDIYDSLGEEREDLRRDADADERVIAALSNDLNTPKAIAALHEIYGELREAKWGDRAAAQAKARSFSASARLLGLDLATDETETHEKLLDHLLAERIDARTAAKVARDFATADRIRDELKGEGILLEDGPSGTTWRRA